MPDLPSSITLTQPADGSKIISADWRNDNTTTQTAVNALITALSSGTAGQLLVATDSDTVTWKQVISGRVASDGSITAGSGFTVSRGSAGSYAITFTAAFASAPVVIATAVGDIVVANLAAESTTTGVTVQTQSTSARADHAFHFIAYGI